MGKTLSHYSQQIKALAPDSLVLDRARELGIVLLEAKAAVLAAGRRWSDWLETDCDLSARTAQRFMGYASRWDEPAFVEARQKRPDLPLREADKVLAASSTRKRAPRQETGTRETLFGAGAVSYYCPACETPYASTLLEKKPILRNLLCAGFLHRPHPATELVPSIFTVGQHQVTLQPLDTSSYASLPVVAALLHKVCPKLLEVGLKGIRAEVTTVGRYLRIRGDTGEDEFLPHSISLALDRSGLVEDVFIGQASSGDVLYATRGGYECRGASQRYAPFWQHLQDSIPWTEASQPPAAAASTASAPVATTPAEAPSAASPTNSQTRRRIRSWIKDNPGHTNLPAAQQWLSRLEANPTESQLHQQALQDLFSAADQSPRPTTPDRTGEKRTRLTKDQGRQLDQIIRDVLNNPPATRTELLATIADKATAIGLPHQPLETIRTRLRRLH